MCSECGYVGDYYDFVQDYGWNDEEDDEIAFLVCPKCGAEDSLQDIEHE